MTFTEENLPITPENLDATPSGFDDMDNYKAETEKLTGLKDLIRASRGNLLGPVFLAGLILGWIVIGWWLWPVKWTNSEPWLLRPERQMTYVGLVAEDYWHTGDISQARKALAGWDDGALANLLATMQSQASSPGKRQHLATLAEALTLPDPEESLLTSLFNHKTIVLSAVLSTAPLVVAIVLAIAPLIRNRTKKPEELLGQGVEELEEELGRLLAEEEEEEETQEEEQETEKEKEWEEKEGEEEEDKEDKENEWLDEEIEEEEDQTMQDILSSIFEEDDETLDYYKSLCKDLEDLDINDLVKKSEEVMDQIVKSNTLRRA